MRHKHRHTNHHAAASLAFKFAPAPLGVTHDASATRPATSTTAPPCPSPTRRARGTGRAIAREAVFESRVVVVVSSSVVRSGHTGISRNAATNRKRSGPYRTATRGVPERSESGDLRTCLVAFSRCDAAAGRPGGCEHFPCLGHSCMTPGRANNHLPLTTDDDEERRTIQDGRQLRSYMVARNMPFPRWADTGPVAWRPPRWHGEGYRVAVHSSWRRPRGGAE